MESKWTRCRRYCSVKDESNERENQMITVEVRRKDEYNKGFEKDKIRGLAKDAKSRGLEKGR